MAITLVPMICPQCGATIDAPVSKDECYCTHCGTKILINNENVKTININHRITDDAQVEKAKAKASDDKMRGIVAIISAAGIIILLIIMVISFSIRDILMR